MLAALMRENPLKGLSFHAAEVNTDFLLGAGTVSPLFIFFCFSICLCFTPGNSFFLGNSFTFCPRLLFLSLTVSFGLFLLLSLIFTYCTFAEGHQYRSGVDNLLRQQENETSSLTINSPLRSVLNQNLSPVLISSQILQVCLSQSMIHLLFISPFSTFKSSSVFFEASTEQAREFSWRTVCKLNFWLNKSVNIFLFKAGLIAYVCLAMEEKERRQAEVIAT